MNPSTNGNGNGSGSSTILYGGAVKLDFEAKGHSYTVTDERGTRQVRSVTQILGVIDKSGPLTQWAANMTVEYIRAAVRPGLRYDEIQLAQIIDQARFNFRTVSKGAKNVGQLAHEWIEAHLRARLRGTPELPLPVNEQARAACGAAAEWIAQHFQARAMEHRIYSREGDFAGTLDVFGDVDGAPAIVDWKTAGAIYREFRLQTAAYAQAWAEMHDERVPDRWVIRLDKDSGEFEAVKFPREEYRADLRGFLAAKALDARLELIKTPRRVAAPQPQTTLAGTVRLAGSAPFAALPSVMPQAVIPQAVPAAAQPGPMAPVRAAIPAQQPYRARARGGRKSREQKICYMEMGGALVLDGATFTIKDELKAMGARGGKNGEQWIWQLPATQYGALANLCVAAGIKLAPASQGRVA